MNEDKLLEKIKHSARSVEPSAKLEPEFIKDRLGEDKKTKRWSDVYRYGKMAAAVCVLLLGAMVLASGGLGAKSADNAAESVKNTSVSDASRNESMASADAEEAV